MGRPVFFNFLEIIIRNTLSCCFITKCKKTANQHTFRFCNHRTRLQNSRFFFLKISKEIGKAWRKSLTRAKRARSLRRREKRLSPVSLSVFSLVLDLLFDCSRLLEYAKIRTVLQSTTKLVHYFFQSVYLV